MELLFGLVIVFLVLGIALATRGDAPAENLSDAGLQAQIDAVQRWIETQSQHINSHPRRQQLCRQKQHYLEALRQELQSRQDGVAGPDK